ncbi:LptF/LptG family permease [Coprobacter tertius]|uniref:LptF/LptG family permease n=1 Tax=Coprobacter tertius TaxID=2944915 RepID=A0ABT1MHB3_9BACT|nr:LptF/LptG family permease [Coprobacter tertius]MCP9612005.1 LptF/LptG family permease [Coprobacter tertius]
MLKKIDFYIIKKFLGTYIFAIILIISIAVVFDINEKLDKFLNAPLKAIVIDYYLNFIPYFANLFSPLFTFIAVIFFTSKLADNSEIIAMLSSGISFKRLMIPYMISAAIIAGGTFYLNSFVIPPANKTRIAFQNKYVSDKSVNYANNIQLQVEPDVIAYISRYDNKTRTGYRFSMEEFDGKTLKSRLTAESVTYDTAYHWVIKNYMIRNFNGLKETLQRGTQLDTVINFEPADFLISRYDSELMTTPALKEYIDRQRKRGVANIKAFEIEYEKRYAMTAAAFILTSIGMSLASRKVKGGMGLNIGIGLLLSFSYILFSTVSSTFAVSGLTSPRIAVWLPNIIYTIIAIYLYRKAPK